MNTKYRWLVYTALVAFSVCSDEMDADTKRTRVQVALDNVRMAIFSFSGDHDGSLPNEWEDLAPYLELDSIEEFSKVIVLLSSSNHNVLVDGNRLLAISAVPRPDGAFEAVDGEAEPRIIRRVSKEQLREAGFNPSSIQAFLNPISLKEQSFGNQFREGESSFDVDRTSPDANSELEVSGKVGYGRTFFLVLAFILVILLRGFCFPRRFASRKEVGSVKK